MNLSKLKISRQNTIGLSEANDESPFSRISPLKKKFEIKVYTSIKEIEVEPTKTAV